MAGDLIDTPEHIRLVAEHVPPIVASALRASPDGMVLDGASLKAIGDGWYEFSVLVKPRTEATDGR